MILAILAVGFCELTAAMFVVASCVSTHLVAEFNGIFLLYSIWISDFYHVEERVHPGYRRSLLF